VDTCFLFIFLTSFHGNDDIRIECVLLFNVIKRYCYQIYNRIVHCKQEKMYYSKTKKYGRSSIITVYNLFSFELFVFLFFQQNNICILEIYTYYGVPISKKKTRLLSLTEMLNGGKAHVPVM